MRVVACSHVFPRTATDPSAPFLLTWARALRRAGADVRVVAPHDAGLPVRQEVGAIPVRLARYAPDRFERVAYRGEMHQLVRTASGRILVGTLVVALARAVRAEARVADVVHVHWWVPGMLAVRLARVAVPVVCTLHGTDVALLESRPRLAALARWALGAAARVETVSTDLAERLERTTGRVADAVNPMPLDPLWFEPPPAAPGRGVGPPRVLAVGRLVPEKGFADLVEAVALLERPPAVTILGEGPERARLAALATARGVRLDLPGRVSLDELRTAYAAADVVVVPSHREGLGLVAAEAVCSGVPVVATDSGGARDVLGAAALVPPRDPAALAARLEATLADPGAARAHALGSRGALAARLAPAAAAERTLAGYRAVGISR